MKLKQQLNSQDLPTLVKSFMKITLHLGMSEKVMQQVVSIGSVFWLI